MLHPRKIVARLMLARSRRTAYSQLRALPKGTRRALVIPPTAAGSIGDAAMMNATRARLRKRGFTHVAVAIADGWDAIEGFDTYLPGDDWFFYERKSALARLVGTLGQFSHSFLIGADCIDGTYNAGSITRRMTLLDEHARLGGRARIMGSSFSAAPKRVAIERLRTLDTSITLCARDPVSRDRLIAATRRDIAQTADLAFLTSADPDHPNAAAALSFIDAQNNAGRSVIALNINCVVEQKHPGFAAAHRQLVSSLLDRGYAVLMVPHDSRGEVNDAALLAGAITEVSPEASERIGWLEESPPAATRAVLARVDAIVTSRMHAAILAMSAGTPAICFTYQGKFEGLYQLLGLIDEGLLFDPAKLVEQPAQTQDAILQQIERRAALAETLSAKLGRVRELADKNFG